MTGKLSTIGLETSRSGKICSVCNSRKHIRYTTFLLVFYCRFCRDFHLLPTQNVYYTKDLIYKKHRGLRYAEAYFQKFLRKNY